ncbi:MAG TPA: hypothetical protein P5080_02265 [Candidatus Paceibacterota bacterium]|nr:hypothetical protein [Candidatus Pacearchaeota archaeon]HRZ50794.1 hypothetical protein [Candidatus Paceibacterota bacterium]HSA36515.1 hypothetical protein [Candidatus Paceibacterota bacterium]
MKSSDWYKKVIIKNTKEIVSSGITYIILVLVLLLWHFAFGIKFQWQNISPLSAPSIFVRVFYSAFTFCTLGFFLYLIKFYKVLHDIVVKAFGMWELYNAIKAILWIFLMWISYAFLVPWLFKVLNTSISVLFNIANLVLYAIPPVGIALILSMIYLIFKNKHLFQK